MNKIRIDGVIGWDVMASDVIGQLDDMNGDITVEISSGGGGVFEGISIYNALRDYDRGIVTVVITSLAASIASYIALAGDKVTAYSNSVVMIHNASVISWGDAAALRKSADILDGLSSIIRKGYMVQTGKGEAEISALMDDETFFYGDEILAFGFADEMIDDDDSDADGDKDEAMAMAHEGFSSAVKSMSEHHQEEDFQLAAALLKDEQVEEPKPSEKEGDDIEVEAENKNASKVNAINARLKVKEKENND